MKKFELLMPEKCKLCPKRDLYIESIDITTIGEAAKGQKSSIDTVYCSNNSLCSYFENKKEGE